MWRTSQSTRTLQNPNSSILQAQAEPLSCQAVCTGSFNLQRGVQPYKIFHVLAALTHSLFWPTACNLFTAMSSIRALHLDMGSCTDTELLKSLWMTSAYLGCGQRATALPIQLSREWPRASRRLQQVLKIQACPVCL